MSSSGAKGLIIGTTRFSLNVPQCENPRKQKEKFYSFIIYTLHLWQSRMHLPATSEMHTNSQFSVCPRLWKLLMEFRLNTIIPYYLSLDCRSALTNMR